MIDEGKNMTKPDDVALDAGAALTPLNELVDGALREMLTGRWAILLREQTPFGASMNRGPDVAKEIAIRAYEAHTRPEPVAMKALDDDQIMEIIKEVAPWKDEPKLNDLLTYEKSPPLFPQATYDVPSYRAEKFVRAVEQRILSALASPADDALLERVMRQAGADLTAAHEEICKLQGLDPKTHTWPEWSSPANTLRWFDEIRSGRTLRGTGEASSADRELEELRRREQSNG